MADPKYRTKVFNYMMEKFINPIIEFDGLRLEEKDGLKYLRYIDGNDGDPYIRDQNDPEKKLVMVTSYEEFVRYKLKREEVSYFNPLTKYKNMLYLVLLSSPVLYNDCCLPDMDDDDDAIEVLSDNDEPDQEDISRCVAITQDSIVKDSITGESVFKFGIDLKKKSTTNLITDLELVDYSFSAESFNKISALIILMMKVLTQLDVREPKIVKEYEENFDNLDLFVQECLDKYTKERKLNNRDMKKMKALETKAGDMEFIIEGEEFEDESILDPNTSVDDLLNEEKETTKVQFNDMLNKGIDSSTLFAGDDKESDQSFADMEFI